MDPLHLAKRSIAPDHLPKVEVPAESVHFIVLWVIILIAAEASAGEETLVAVRESGWE